MKGVAVSMDVETEYSYEFVGESLYPLTEGKVVTVTETMTMGEGMNFDDMSGFFEGEESPEDAGDFSRGTAQGPIGTRWEVRQSKSLFPLALLSV